MAKKTAAKEKALYKVHCTECGEVIGNKIFFLNDMLKQYYVGNNFESTIQFLLNTLRIGARYGETVLPEVPALVDQNGNWNFNKLDFAQFRRTLPEFTCKDNEVPTNELVAVNLNIASIVAQFCMITGFDDIYQMLALQQQLDALYEQGKTPSEAQNTAWTNFCDRFSKLPDVRMDATLTAAEIEQESTELMSGILELATAEANVLGRQHFAKHDIEIGWQYKEENNRWLPFSLVVRRADHKRFDVKECCCDKCHKPISWELGAYEQRVIGILGTQAAGKTSYLMALADAIPNIKFQNMSDAEEPHMSITYDPEDPQWKRVEENEGLLWKYQHGFVPQKTEVDVGKAPALTFKVQKNKKAEPVMYTLADIPGEAFYDQNNNKYPQSLIDALQRLLKASHALILVVNKKQLKKAAREEKEEQLKEVAQNEVEHHADEGEEESKLVTNPNVILTKLKDFLPQKASSTAVVLTAADKLGDLRSLLGLAYDIRKVEPKVYSEQSKLYVYNTEAMNTASQATECYINDNFGQFMSNVKTTVPTGSEITAFAVSNGTQCAAEIKSDTTPEELAQLKIKSACTARYNKMVAERFGVEAPLLWLLTCDNMLSRGRTDKYFDRYEEKDRDRILAEISRKES